MSDTSQGEGWWQASDGKWYPPTASPAPPPATQTPPATTQMPPVTPADPAANQPTSQMPPVTAPASTAAATEVAPAGGYGAAVADGDAEKPGRPSWLVPVIIVGRGPGGGHRGAGHRAGLEGLDLARDHHDHGDDVYHRPHHQHRANHHHDRRAHDHDHGGHHLDLDDHHERAHHHDHRRSLIGGCWMVTELLP